MKESKKFIIFISFALLIYIAHIIRALIIGANVYTCIMGWICCILWMLLFTIDRYLMLKQIEKEDEEEFCDEIIEEVDQEE